MALNDNNAKTFEPAYYAKTYINNYSNNTVINVTYSSGLMKISIANRDSSNGKTEEIINASLTGLKAQILVNALDQMERDIENGEAEGKAYGTSVGMGEVVKAVAFTVIGGDIKFLIAKVDKEGKVSDKTIYEFPKETDYYMSWSNFDSMDFNRVYDDKIQYNMLKNILKDFARNISGAAAYGGLYLNRYEQNRDRGKITRIMDKLGINVQSGGQNYQRSNDSYFNNYSGGGNKTSEHKEFTDIEDMFGSEDD